MKFDNYPDSVEITNTLAEIILYELDKLNQKEKLQYIKDVLYFINRSSVAEYYEDLGCLENYLDNIQDFEEFRKAAS
jgi:hypothetical protein